MDQLKINLFEANKIDKFTCKKISVDVPPMSEITHRLFQKKIFNILSGDVYGTMHKGTLYFNGQEESVIKGLEELKGEFKDFEYDYTEEVELSFPDDLFLIKKLILRSLDGIILNRKFMKTGHRKIIPSTDLINEYKSLYSFVYECSVGRTKFLRGFRYRFFIYIQGYCYLQIDPCISVITPYQGEDVKWLTPHCFNQECGYKHRCTFLPKNSVKDPRIVDEEIKDCPCWREDPQSVSVYDPKKRCRVTVPLSCLFLESKSAYIDYMELRDFALINSSERLRKTKEIFNILFPKDKKPELTIGENVISFDREPVNLSNSNELGTLTNFTQIPEPEIKFGDEVSHIDPLKGMNRYGMYSFNKRSDTKYKHPTPTLIIIYPDTCSTQIDLLIERFNKGKYHYLGFKEDDNPFHTKLNIETYALPVAEYDPSMIKIKILNSMDELGTLSKDTDTVFLIVLPRGCGDEFYNDVKGFCIRQNVRSQMIHERTLTSKNLNNEWILSNLSLGIYTKAGGTPWVVDDSYFDIADCFIAMQFSIRKTERFGDIRFYVGNADVFNSSGEHLSCYVHSGKVDMSELPRGLYVDKEFMKSLVGNAVSRYTDRERYSPKTILFHRQSPFCLQEIKGIKDVMKENEIETAFLVHLQNNNGFRGYGTGGSPVPRGTLFRFSPNSVILFPTGYIDFKDKYSGLGTPRPTQVNVKKINANGEVMTDINDQELLEICRNYIGFTRIRWNTVTLGVRNPFTIHVSRIYANWAKEGIENLPDVDIRNII